MIIVSIQAYFGELIAIIFFYFSHLLLLTRELIKTGSDVEEMSLRRSGNCVRADRGRGNDWCQP